MQKPSFFEAIRFWLKLGCISFGGPAGQIAIMHEFLVEKKKWISESKFLHALNYCMLLPGPEAQQLATYTGWLLHGIRGGLAAGILFVLPSMFLLLGLSIIYVSFGHLPWIYAMFAALKPAVIAIVITALMKIGAKSLKNSLHYGVALGAFVGIFFFNIPFPVIILSALLFASILSFSNATLLHNRKAYDEIKTGDENEYFINKNTVIPNIGFKPFRFWKQAITGVTLWTVPLISFYFLTSDFAFWQKLSLFFTKAALVTFGGAYAVLPYVAQVSVEKFHWLSQWQVIDGMALGETTPGPLIMILTFVGFMAGYNHFEHSILMGTIGLLTTTFYTFLPCFIFIFVGAPVIERTHQNKRIGEILPFVSAAVVGVILNLTLYLGKAVLFPKGFTFENVDYTALVWMLLSFLALYQFRINLILWIGISALFGLGHHFII